MCPTSKAYPRAKKKSSIPQTCFGLDTSGSLHDIQALTPNLKLNTKNTTPVRAQHPMKTFVPGSGQSLLRKRSRDRTSVDIWSIRSWDIHDVSQDVGQRLARSAAQFTGLLTASHTVSPQTLNKPVTRIRWQSCSPTSAVGRPFVQFLSTTLL